MKPIKLTICNIGPFSSENTIDFDSLGDIFLISGKTGSGKTTVFDSMFYALYGSLPGTRSGTDKNLLKSQFASQDKDSYVDFIFKLNNTKYRIIRHPPYKKISGKTGKFTTVEEKAVFYRIHPGGEQNLESDKISEIKKIVENLLGLSEEEFASIILLPQGRFAEFLHMNSTDRKEVMLKLFPVEKYRQVIISALEKNKLNKAKIESIENQLISLQNEFNPENAAIEIPGHEKKLETVKSDMKKNQNEITEYSNQIEKAEAKIILKNKLDKLNQKEEYLKNKKDLIEQYKQMLKLAPKARNLLRLLNQKIELSADITDKNNSIKSLGIQKAETEITIKKLESELKKIPELKNTRENLSKDFDSISKAKKSYELFDSNSIRINELEQLKHENRNSINFLAENTKAMEKELREIEEKTENLTGLYEAKELQNQIRDLLLSIMNDIYTVVNEQDNLKKIESSNLEINNNIKQIESRISKKTKDIKTLKEKKEKNLNENLAGRLSLLLVENEPCPVCGSTGHPNPAKGIEIDVSLDSVLQILETEIQNLEKDKVKALTILEQNNSESGNKISNLETITKKLESNIDNLLLKNALVKDDTISIKINDKAIREIYPKEDINQTFISVIEKEIEKAENNIAQIQNRINTNINLQNQLNEIKNKITENERHRKEEENKGVNLDRELAEKKEINAPLKENLQTALNIISKYYPINDSTFVTLDYLINTEENLKDSLNETDLKIETINQNYNDNEKKLFSISSKLETLDIELKKNLAKMKEVDSGFAEESKKFIEVYETVPKEIILKITKNSLLSDIICLRKIIEDFSGRQDDKIPEELVLLMKTLSISENDETVYSEEITLYEKDKTENKANIKNIKEELEKLDEVPEPGTLKEKLILLKDKDTRLLNEFRNITDTINTLKNRLKTWEKLENERNTLSEQSKALNSLAMDLNGNNPKNKTFDAWILANYLEEISKYASIRLDKMSGGRFRLLVNTEQKKGNAKTGLDLEIFDSYTGKKRPCTTLSGGETFMTSISLALGLADSIQNKNGNIELDSVFIDEGFGSLDPETLEKAMEILEEIRGHRTVGIISHIGELKEWIPSMVQIEKTEKGSFIL